MIANVISSVCYLTGGVLALTAGAGLQRFDNVFSRMHAATKPATLGLVLIMVGAAFQVGAPGDVVKLLVVVMLQFVTAPVAAQLLGRAAYGIEEDLDAEDDATVEAGADAVLKDES